MAERPRGSRWLAPSVVFVAVVVVILLQVLLSPSDDTLSMTPSLSSRSTRPYGAQGFYELLERLGWRVGRRATPLIEPLDSAATYVVLQGELALSRGEVHRLMEAVRRGASLLVVPTQGSGIADSLGVTASETSYGTTVLAPDSGSAEDDDAEHATAAPDSAAAARPTGAAADSAGPGFAAGVWPDPARRQELPLDTTELGAAARDLKFVRHVLEPVDTSAGARGRFPGDTVTFLKARAFGRRIAPVIIGMRVGQGRVVAVADPFLLTNRIVREGDAALILVRAMEWLTYAREAAPVVFDEYRHEMTVGPGPVRRALFGTPLGRTAVQILLAAVLLVLAIGARPLVPRARMRTERRSPFEHVGALARAYEQVRATRTASRRLLHGLRRRHPVGRVSSDEAYLAALAARYPDTSTEIALVRGATRTPLEPEAFLAVGHALEAIERKIES
jgi:hypothetical protein